MIKPPRWLVLALPFALYGCSFSDSSKSSSDSGSSISDSASSPSGWLSDSSKTDKQRYQSDVRDYTAEFTKASSGTLVGFQAKVGKLAEKYGVINWEDDLETYVAIGQGLKKAGLKGPQYDAFKNSLGGTPKRMQAIDRGYR